MESSLALPRKEGGGQAESPGAEASVAAGLPPGLAGGRETAPWTAPPRPGGRRDGASSEAVWPAEQEAWPTSWPKQGDVLESVLMMGSSLEKHPFHPTAQPVGRDTAIPQLCFESWWVVPYHFSSVGRGTFLSLEPQRNLPSLPTGTAAGPGSRPLSAGSRVFEPRRTVLPAAVRRPAAFPSQVSFPRYSSSSLKSEFYQETYLGFRVFSSIFFY